MAALGDTEFALLAYTSLLRLSVPRPYKLLRLVKTLQAKLRTSPTKVADAPLTRLRRPFRPIGAPRPSRVGRLRTTTNKRPPALILLVRLPPVRPELATIDAAILPTILTDAYATPAKDEELQIRSPRPSLADAAAVLSLTTGLGVLRDKAADSLRPDPSRPSRRPRLNARPLRP